MDSTSPSEPGREREKELAGASSRALRGSVVFVGEILAHEVHAHPLAGPRPCVAHRRVKKGIGLVRGLGPVGQDRLIVDEIESTGHIKTLKAILREVVTRPEIGEVRCTHLQGGIVKQAHSLVIFLSGGIEG